jgi:hypothetical protein
MKTIYTIEKLQTREDGTRYLLDIAEYEKQLDYAKEIVEKYNQVAQLLTEYEDTRERVKSPEYLGGVFESGSRFIKESRAEEIRNAMRLFPIGHKALQRNIDDTIEEMESLDLFERLDKLLSEISAIKSRASFNIGLTALSFSQDKKGKHKISLATTFPEELHKAMRREVSEEQIEDMETFRKAVEMLWTLCDKGYFLSSPYNRLHNLYTPSLLDHLMSEKTYNEENRDEMVTDERLLNKLYKIKK